MQDSDNVEVSCGQWLNGTAPIICPSYWPSTLIKGYIALRGGVVLAGTGDNSQVYRYLMKIIDVHKEAVLRRYLIKQ